LEDDRAELVIRLSRFREIPGRPEDEPFAVLQHEVAPDVDEKRECAQRLVPAQGVDNLRAVTVGEAEVEDEDVRLQGMRRGDRIRGRGGPLRRNPVLSESKLENREQLLVVVDEKREPPGALDVPAERRARERREGNAEPERASRRLRIPHT